MAVRIEEVFRVAAPPDAVWAYLIDPEQVVVCLPGANLTEVQDDRMYRGTVKVKVGPVTASYRGKVQITEQDDEGRTVKMLGEGMESSGAGSAKMELTSQVVALEDGGTEVRVQQDIEVVGKLAQFGRGMVQEVGKQLFRQFVTCAQAHLESGTSQAAEAEARIPAGAPGTDEEGVGGALRTESAPAGGGAQASGTGGTPPTTSAKQDDTIGGIGLFFRALWSLITRPFRRG